MPEEGKSQRREVFYQGMVQGVGFRFTTRQLAARFAVTGYVQNLADGRVLLVAEGDAGEVQRFLDSVHMKLGQYVTQTSQRVSAPTGKFGEFDIRF